MIHNYSKEGLLKKPIQGKKKIFQRAFILQMLLIYQLKIH